MKVLLLLAFLLSSVLSDTDAEKVSYSGYTVLRMQINSTNYEDIRTTAEKFNLDVWAQNARENWMDIMIPPNSDVLKVLKQHDHIVHIEDVEEHIQSIEGLNPNNGSRKRQVFFDYFPTWDEVSEWLDVQHDLHPDTSELVVSGQTYLGRDIRGIKIFNNNNPGTKKVIYIQGGIHAREWITVTTTLYIIQQLLEENPAIVDNFDFYIFPVFNIDGYIHTRTERLWRKNRQPNAGSTCIGTDINRNYNFEWGRGGSSTNPCSDTFMGARAESTPEVETTSNYFLNLGEVVFYLDVHSYGGMWMSPFGYTYNLPPDYEEMWAVMEVARSAIRTVNGNVYSIGNSADVIYIVSGGAKDWAYARKDVVPSFTVEIIGTSFIEPTSRILPLAREIWNGVHSVSEYLIANQN